MKSKFKLRTLLIPFLIVMFTFISIFILIKSLPIKIEELRWIDIYMALLVVFTWIWLVFGEFRTKVIEVSLNNTEIEKKNYLGLKQKYKYKDFDGYQTSILTSKGQSFEYLYLIKNNQKIVKISEYYHKNYYDLKNEISIDLKNLGEIKLSYFDELKEIFR
ncbi:hypothetical protein J0383_06870 [Flavobacterium endoglycinae]|uniref:Uncharacterized protein n=1 Tax=Flavobacterium endoglycinae TaxID=2816357 RepID=A0ABX7QHH2_9FLAO|nr:hypothetical protein [Flavobacterium endoglycinae]QSW90525.1 hypothetical protein J0383_06870 [Flavobacterium endoglycinae]